MKLKEVYVYYSIIQNFQVWRKLYLFCVPGLVVFRVIKFEYYI